MRFVALQQVNGPLWVVYDTFADEIVTSFNDKSAREAATEMADLLSRGYEQKVQAGQVTTTMQALPKIVRSRKKRQPVL